VENVVCLQSDANKPKEFSFVIHASGSGSNAGLAQPSVVTCVPV